MSGEAIQSESYWREILSNFLLNGEAIQSLQRVGDGLSGADVVRVESTAGIHALRGWPRDSLPQARIFELHRFLAFLQTHDLPVAVPIENRSQGKTLVNFNDQLWQLEPWRPGTELDQNDVCDESVTSAMETLALLHSVSIQYEASKNGRAWFFVDLRPIPAIVERIKLIEKWSQRLRKKNDLPSEMKHELREIGQAIISHFQQFSDGIRNQLKSLERTPCPVFPCWRDLWNAHVLFEGTDVSGLIDASAARTDHPGTDLSRYLGSIFGDEFDRWNFALSAYSQIRPLSEDDYRLISVLDRSSVLLSGLTWIDRWKSGAVPVSMQLPALARMAKIELRMRNLSRRVSLTPKPFQIL